MSTRKQQTDIRTIHVLLFLLSLTEEIHASNLFANVQGFCARVPTEEELDDTSCSSEVFVSPLKRLRYCCDLGSDGDIRSCLGRELERDRLMQRAYLEWKESPEREAQYVEQLQNCAAELRHLRERDCHDDTCVDPASAIDACDPSSDRERCIRDVIATVAKAAMASMCVMVEPKCPPSQRCPEDHESVSHRCYRQQALNRMWQGLSTMAEHLNAYCYQKKYGRYADPENVAFESTLKQALPDNPEQVETLMMSREGLQDAGRHWQEAIIGTLCGEEDPASQFIRRCPDTPVMMNHLNYQDLGDTQRDIRQCCDSTSTIDRRVECFEERGISPELYSTTGNYFRSLIRAATGVQHECITPEAAAEGRTYYYDREMPRDEKQTYFFDVRPTEYHDQLKNAFWEPDFKLDPTNYHFFLRPFTKHQYDYAKHVHIPESEFIEAACSACQVGERLGTQAYSFPALMCPALVYKNYYNPLKFETDCPDKLFYQVQVAHYCCLYAAFDKYQLDGIDPTTCPDV